MPFEWPVEIDPSRFSPSNIQEQYLDFGVISENFDTLLQAFLVTFVLALLAELLGIILGLVLALMKIGRSKILSAPAQVYIDGIRIESLFFAGLVALTLNSAAYVAEIFRSGIQSIDKGQMEAGRASGLTYAQTMRHIIVPQAFRRVIPPLTNEFVMLIKDTSIVSVIGLEELLRSARVIQSATANATPLVAAALFYLAICLPLIYLANGLERRLNRRTA